MKIKSMNLTVGGLQVFGGGHSSVDVILNDVVIGDVISEIGVEDLLKEIEIKEVIAYYGEDRLQSLINIDDILK
jgi:hypothetical protein